MQHFQRAIELAESAAGWVSPRPPVGAVVVSVDGEVVGEGATAQRPGPHAEAAALDAAGGLARGGTLYSTLEPHQYQSHVAPCTERIIDAGIATVVCPVVDPSPEINGKGFEALTNAGITLIRDVHDGDMVRNAQSLIEPFVKLRMHGTPLVTCKWGMSLDGAVATRTGDSQWISSAECLQFTHRMRYRADVVLTGIGTVLADDPQLTARDLDTGARVGDRPRVRVVVDSKGRLPADAALLQQPGDILHAVAIPTNSPDGCETLMLPDDTREANAPPKVDLGALAAELGRRGLANVIVDAGPELTGSLIERGLVDKVVASISTRVMIGGRDALHSIGGDGPALLAHAPRLRDVRSQTVGDDIVVEGYVEYGVAGSPS